jgi:hypothetical protein
MNEVNEHPTPADAEGQSSATVTKEPSRVHSWFRRVFIALMLTIVAMCVFAWYAYQTAQVVPVYYQELLEQPPEELAEAGDQFESQLLEFQNVAIEVGEWQADFTQDQINGWIASDVPQKFPDAIPTNISKPRIALNENEVKIIFRFESTRFSGIVEASGDAFCTERLNEIAIRIHHLKSGLVSLPIAPWTDRISKMFEESRVPIQWTEDDGDMVALVQLPSNISDEKDQKRIIEAIEIKSGSASFRGVTLAPGDLETYQASRNQDGTPSLKR